MTAIPRAAEALASASGRFERSSLRLLDAVSGGGEDAGGALADIMTAKVQYKASLAVIRFSNEMWDALLDLRRSER